MLERLQARLSSRRSSPPPSPPSYADSNDCGANESSVPPTQSRHTGRPPLLRTLSNTSTLTTTTLPPYSDVGRTTSPPQYVSIQTQTAVDSLTSRLSEYQSAPLEPLTSPPPVSRNPHFPPSLNYPVYSPRASATAITHPTTSIHWFDKIVQAHSLGQLRPADSQKYGIRSGKQRRRPIREIPLDHPVHDLPADEQASLRRRGLDPVIVAEMRESHSSRARRIRAFSVHDDVVWE